MMIVNKHWHSHLKIFYCSVRASGKVQQCSLMEKGGIVLADRYTVVVVVDLQIRFSTDNENGGIRHRNASTVGIKYCHAIKCYYEDLCMTDGREKGQLRVFPGRRFL